MAARRPTSWWLAQLRRRADRMGGETLDFSNPVPFSSDVERRAALKFFNAAFRAEESGLRQAHELATDMEELDPELAECLRLYGNEEGWHRELLTAFLGHLGGGVQPMGRVTRAFYRVYGRAKRVETIVLTNLMFETIGATTYRLALRRAKDPSVRRMLAILVRDESFHVPLNVHFLREALARNPNPGSARARMKVVYRVLFVALLGMAWASRKTEPFDGIPLGELARAYAEHLGALFAREEDLGLTPPRGILWVLGIDHDGLTRGEAAAVTSVEAAERASERESVVVEAL